MAFLPTTCSAHQGVCFAAAATYIWDIESYHKNCDFTFYKQASFLMIKPRNYIDNGNKILIRFPEIKTNTVTCDKRTMGIRKTNNQNPSQSNYSKTGMEYDRLTRFTSDDGSFYKLSYL